MKKQGPLAKPAIVARVIRGSRRYIRRLKRSSFESFDEAKEWLSTIIDSSLQGGLHKGCYLLQPSGNEGDPTLPIWNVTAKWISEKSQEDFYTDTCLGPRKNPRAEQEIVVDFLGRKEQRITGAFGEGITGSNY
jgi:hypothetical protein